MADNKYDIIVIGGGHAGIEASYVASLMGCKTAMVTMDLKTIGKPSCNPSIGGTAKGHLVKEIDSLGGAIGLLADKAGIQFKMLNRSKGPAVWSPRAQIDKDLYPIYALELLSKTKNLTLISGTAIEILIDKNKVKGIKTINNEYIYSKAVVFCPGTFLNGVMYTGLLTSKGGRFGEKPADIISNILNKMGLELGRLKTGTPPRLRADSIDFSKTEPNYGDNPPIPFSHKTKQVTNRAICYTTQTTAETHDILKTGFASSPMFIGLISGVGPRYCPSIEDKVSRFAERDSHKIVLEPEGLNTNSVYVNGFSTSLPEDIQMKGIHSISGLEKAEFIRPGYAIEYDYFYPYQLKFSLETKMIEGLYLAGQLNGTSGYEEAAAQGLMAGINAAQRIKGKEEFTLKRSESYIGVLIDDLVNKRTEEPYRIFTSLAEYRLILRQDNARDRLMKYGFDLGLVSKEHYDSSLDFINKLNSAYEYSKSIKIKAKDANIYLDEKNETTIIDSTDIYTLAKRNSLNIKKLFQMSDNIPDDLNRLLKRKDILSRLQIEIKYEGYIKQQNKEIDYFLENENKRIPGNFDYSKINSLSNEAREKLNKIRPASLGQASRISGVSATDVSFIALYLK